MPRSGSGAYSAPPSIRAEPNTTIRSAQFNGLMDDLVEEANNPRPLAYGGTGGTSQATARVNLGLIPQSDTADTTANRLMLTGAGGWLATDGIAVPGDDCNLITRTGLYRGVTGTTANLPVANDCAILHLGRTTSRARQIAFGAADLIYARRLEGTWGDWTTIDQVTESGSNANGRFIKYASGRIECRATITFTSAISTAFMGAFRSPAQTWTFPTSFNDGSGNPDVFVTPSLGTAFSAVRISATTATQAFFAVTAISSQSSDSRTVSLYAVRF